MAKFKTNKYHRLIVGRKEDGKKIAVYVDVYDVLKAFTITCPAMAHAIKKNLAPGQRGVKTSLQDKKEAVQSIERSIDMELDDEGSN